MATKQRPIMKGRDLMVFVKVGDTYKPIKGQNGTNLEPEAGQREITTTESGAWKDYDIDLHGWAASTELLYVDPLDDDTDAISFDELDSAMWDGTKFDFVFAFVNAERTVDTTRPIRSGKGLVAVSSSFPNSGNATGSLKITGCGALTKD